MRQSKGTPLSRRAALIVLAVAMLATIAVPAIASAATPRSTLIMSTTYQPVAKSFTVSGKISPSLHGQKITVEIRKPGRTFWTRVGSVTISTTGTWHLHYTPKLGGKFYVRARYGATTAGLSRTASLTVKRAPASRRRSACVDYVDP